MKKHGILKSKFSLLTGAFLSSLAIVALALVIGPTMASATSGIVIHGSEKASSHLQLTVSEEALVVNGFTEFSDQPGCEFTHGQNALRCPLPGVSQVEVDMGISNDKVEVLDPLPIPLVAHMGGGSDKFVGSDEPDTCYLEGNSKSSCESGGGNDVCISGAGSDGCYLGPGNDACKGGAGEDKCLGEVGNDLLRGGSGSDHLSGGPGNDRVYGEADSDKLYGDTGNDYVNGGSSPDKAYGGPGNDHLLGGPSPDKLYGEAGKDYCNGGPGVGKSESCESGPGH